MVQPMRRDPHAQTRPQMAQFATDLYEQTTTLNNAFTAGAPIQNQIEDDLARILERATEMSPHNTVALEINVQNALHLVRSRWNELVAAGRMSKRRYQHAAFDAVGKFEHAESEQELRDYVERLKQQTSDLDIMIATTGGDDILTARYDSLKVDLRKAEKRLRALVFDVRFLTARTLIDRLEAAPWGVNPDEETANGASEHDLTNSTLKRFNAAMKTLMDRIDNRYGPADWSTDVTSEVSLVEDDETRQASGERQPRWSHDEWLEIINIEHCYPDTTAQTKTDMLNECMAVRRARQGLPKPLDRSVGVFAKQLRGELKDFRAD